MFVCEEEKREDAKTWQLAGRLQAACSHLSLLL